jgi:hypothetical protein
VYEITKPRQGNSGVRRYVEVLAMPGGDNVSGVRAMSDLNTLPAFEDDFSLVEFRFDERRAMSLQTYIDELWNSNRRDYTPAPLPVRGIQAGAAPGECEPPNHCRRLRTNAWVSAASCWGSHGAIALVHTHPAACYLDKDTYGVRHLCQKTACASCLAAHPCARARTSATA